MVIRIGFAPWAPWAVAVKQGNMTGLGGIAKDVYESMREHLHFNYKANLQEDLIFGSLGPDGVWSGMLGGMQRNELDLSGPYFISEERSTLVNFSVPLSFSQLAIMSGLTAANRDPLLIFRIFTYSVWLFAVVSTLLASGAAATIYLIFPSTFIKRSESEAFLKYMWMFYGTLLGKECGSQNRWFLNHTLTAASFRLLLGTWLLGPALVLMYTYQGAITSTFAADKLKPLVASLEELDQSKNVKPATYANSYPSVCFEGLKGTNLDSLSARIRENYEKPGTTHSPTWIKDVEDGKLAFVAELVTAKAMVSERFIETGVCGLYVTPIDLCPAYIAFAFRNNYKLQLQQEFNKRLLWFSEGRLFHRRMLASLAKYETCTRMSTNTANPLELSDLFGALIIYLTGTSVSAFVFLIERASKFKKSSK